MNGPNISVKIGDFFGIGEAVHSVPDTIEAVGHCGKNLAEAGSITVDTVEKISELPFNFSKNYEDFVDRNRERRIKEIQNANLPLNEEDKEKLKEERENIKNKYNNNIPEHELFRLREIDTYLKGGNIENGGIKNQLKTAIEDIKDVEMKQSVFRNSNIGAHFQQINNVLQNHEGRIGVLEGTVAEHGKILSNHENRIGKLENTVDLHSRQLANHEGRIGKLEGTVAMHGKMLANHEGRIGKLEGTVSQHSKQIQQLGNIVNVHTQQIENLNNRVNENTHNIQILNDRTNQIQQNVNYLNNAVKDLGNEIVNTNKRMDEGFNVLQNNIIKSHDILHGEIVQTNEKMNEGFNILQNNIKNTRDVLHSEIVYTNEKMDKGFNILEDNIKNNYNILHGEVLQTNERMDKGFNYLNDEIKDTNKAMILGFNNIKEDIKDVRNEIKENSFYLNNQISNLNNLYLQQFSKTNDELKNQNKKIVENEIKLNEHDKTLNLLINSNIKQKEKINEHEIMLNKHQDYLMHCIENVKGLYEEANELRNNLIEEDKKINQIALKNEADISDIRNQCKEGLEKVNEITQILNKHTEILTEQSTTIAKNKLYHLKIRKK